MGWGQVLYRNGRDYSRGQGLRARLGRGMARGQWRMETVLPGRRLTVNPGPTRNRPSRRPFYRPSRPPPTVIPA